MSISKPFHRIVRSLVERPNSGYSSWAYVADPGYAVNPEHYVKGFLLIQNDLQKLFEYIEPSDMNLETYSFRTHEILMRTCIEIEANFKGILQENIYNPKNEKGESIPESRWNISNYRILNKTHHLSSYKIHIPAWDGDGSVFIPFSSWNHGGALSWYQAYNKSKHDRLTEFRQANFRNMLGAITGLVALLSAQFRDRDFMPGDDLISAGSERPRRGDPAIGGYFCVEYPNDWSIDEKYDFDWASLKTQDVRFQKYNYDALDAGA